MRILLACILGAAVLVAPVQAATLDSRVDRLERLVKAQAATIKSLRKQAASLRSRATKLESKTSYYRLRQKTVGTGKVTAASAGPDAVITNGVLTQTVTAPNDTSPWIAHVWVTGTVGYDADNFLVWELMSTAFAGEKCRGVFNNLNGAGTATIDAYCTIDLAPGDDLKLVAEAWNEGSQGVVTSGSLVIKTNFVEMVEPE